MEGGGTKNPCFYIERGNGPKEEISGNRISRKCYNFPNGDESHDMIG